MVLRPVLGVGLGMLSPVRCLLILKCSNSQVLLETEIGKKSFSRSNLQNEGKAKTISVHAQLQTLGKLWISFRRLHFGMYKASRLIDVFI